MEIIQRIKDRGLKGMMSLSRDHVSGLNSKVYSLFAGASARLASDGLYTLQSVQGSKMLLSLNDEGISRELLMTGVHEPVSTCVFKDIVGSGWTLFEVGANIGYYALIGSRQAGPKGSIIACEPSPVNFEALKMNLMLNGLLDRTELHCTAVGASVGTVNFNLMNKGNMSSIYDRHQGQGISKNESIQVPMTTLDVIYQKKRRKIDFVRMDVEGYEWEIIKGMETLFNSPHSPEGFFIEIHSELLVENQQSCTGFVRHLAERGYRIHLGHFRGNAEQKVKSIDELLGHSLCEKGYWEVFFVKS